jgi:hypothetical protein
MQPLGIARVLHGSRDLDDCQKTKRFGVGIFPFWDQVRLSAGRAAIAA